MFSVPCVHSNYPGSLLPVLSCTYLVFYNQNACECGRLCMCVCVKLSLFLDLFLRCILLVVKCRGAVCVCVRFSAVIILIN